MSYYFWEVIHQISRSHGLKNLRFESNLSEITRPVAAVKPLRFALFHQVSIDWSKSEGFDTATGLVILLKSDSNHRFFILYDLEIRWMTLKNNRAPLLGYVKLCALFQSHQ